MERVFIEVVGQVDSFMGFINYRTMIYAFQEEVVPIIAESIIPHFLAI